MHAAAAWLHPVALRCVAWAQRTLLEELGVVKGGRRGKGSAVQTREEMEEEARRLAGTLEGDGAAVQWGGSGLDLPAGADLEAQVREGAHTLALLRRATPPAQLCGTEGRLARVCVCAHVAGWLCVRSGCCPACSSPTRSRSCCGTSGTRT